LSLVKSIPKLEEDGEL